MILFFFFSSFLLPFFVYYDLPFLNNFLIFPNYFSTFFTSFLFLVKIHLKIILKDIFSLSLLLNRKGLREKGRKVDKCA